MCYHSDPKYKEGLVMNINTERSLHFGSGQKVTHAIIGVKYTAPVFFVGSPSSLEEPHVGLVQN